MTEDAQRPNLRSRRRRQYRVPRHVFVVTVVAT